MDMFVLARDGSPCPPEPSRGGISTDGEILSWNAGQMEEWMTGKVFSFLFFCRDVRNKITGQVWEKGDERAWRRCESSVEKLSSESTKDAVFNKVLHFIKEKLQLLLYIVDLWRI